MAENNERDSVLDNVLKRTIADPKAPVNLKKQTRIHENIIQLFLLACGVLSIFTTIGILVVLLSESLTFFNRDIWENTNRPLSVSITAEDTAFTTEARGRELEEGINIRIGEEEMFLETYISNHIAIEVTGTGGGFERFCAGQTDINEASRPITNEELEICRANNIEPVELHVGTDALAIVINSENDFLSDVTLEELAEIFGDAQFWSDIRPEYPNQPILRFIPGMDSGTFDYFVDVVYNGDDSLLVGVDATRVSSDELVTSEDDNQLVRGISNNPYAIGFFGYSYYLENQDTLSTLSINGVTPSNETVVDGSYIFSRPLFIYTSEAKLSESPHLATFINYYLQQAPQVIETVGYFPASQNITNDTRTEYLNAIGADIVTDDSGLITLPEVNLDAVAGDINIAGSSTVFPLTQEIADSYIADADGYLPVATVIRGINDTFIEDHNAGTVIEVGERVSLVEFFTGTEWQPAIRDFGIFPLVYGTLATSFIAMLVALPLGIGAAIYLSEYAPENVRKTLKPILEILAGIPTVVYGYFALTFMTPFLQGIFGDVVQIYNSTSAGIVVGILIIPMVSSMSEDALSAVPRALREASYGLGATKLETTVKVVIPAALSGIMAAFIIAVSRAIGETMIVAIAAGAGPQNDIPRLLQTRGLGILFEPAETMTGHIARISGGDLSYGSIDYNSIFAIGLLLFVITFVLNIINNAIIKRFRETY